MENKPPVSRSLTAILVVDIGLTNCKTLIFSERGEILAGITTPYVTYYPTSTQVEQAPEDWWRAVCSATNSLWQTNPDLAASIQGISVTGHMHALVCLGKERQTLGRSLILGDQRSKAEVEEITCALGLSTIYKITGARMDASMPAAKLRWLKKNDPNLLRATHLIVGCKDVIRQWMTGDRFTDPIDACATSLYDLDKNTWSKELAELAGIESGCLPDVIDPTTVAGQLRREPAAQLGLRSGIPVVVGAGDDIEILGNGILEPGLAMEHLATTGSVLTCIDHPVYDPEMALELYPHAQAGRWVLGGSITMAGAALSWTAKTLGYDSLDQAFLSLCERGFRPSDQSITFVPHLQGERCPNWEPDVRGAWVGLLANHRKQDLMMASLEGVVYALKSILVRIDNLAGNHKQIRVVKGENELLDWLRLRANIYNKPLGVLTHDQPTGLGAMMLASVAIGLYTNLKEAMKVIVSLKTTIQPERQKILHYQHGFSRFERIRSALGKIWDE